MKEPILKMLGISKSFSTVEVLHNVDFTLNIGEIHGLVGQNGAGKSTLMKILNGVEVKDSGNIIIFGKEEEYNNPIQAREKGISMIFQEFSLVSSLTVSQNIFLTRESHNFLRLLKDKESEKNTIKILKELDVENINPNEYVENLGTGPQQIVEIAKALSHEPKILIMDEPTASLSSHEIESLFIVINKLKKRGISIIFVSHYLREIFEICDRVTVLRDGNKVFEEKILNTNLKEVIAKMTGKEQDLQVSKRKRQIDRSKPPLLEINNLVVGDIVKGISFKVWHGEIFGIAGLLGSGRSEIINSIYGVYKKKKGEIIIDEKRTSINSPNDAIRAGIAIVPEDRREHGLILDFSIKDNILFSVIKKILSFIFINDKKASKITNDSINKLNIKASGFWQVVKFLSGGNQQKVVVAKSLVTDSKILLLDDPSIGIDIQAKSEIMNIINDFVESGNGVIFVSSEFDELVSFCDRILVLKKGEVDSIVDCGIEANMSEEILLEKIQ
ncbi:MAG: sugar ABC transporter ATP-binding protein [Spirochaetota bacterium]|nr:MAG: sugar ABC transporter ATP-binding protein [Spirochaetota bacterium]